MAADAPPDPARVAAVLWGAWRRPTRGPAPGLTVARIVAATVETIEDVGFDAVTMRHVAARLGVGAATLYTYVPGKAELFALVLDESVGHDALPDDLPGDWRARTAAWARADFADYRARPWVLRLAAGPIVPGPNLLRWYDAALRVLEGLGLTPQEMVAVVDGVDAYTRGVARSAQVSGAEETPEAPPGPSPYPTLARLTEAGAFGDPDATFEFGLQRLLDGVETLIASRAAAP
jgi:AcrR family transcriptional regulator